PGGRKVILWPDTFTNHFDTEVGVAAVEALEDAGFRVVVPEGHLCCGRPLYDYGMLSLAQRYLGRVLGALRAEIRAGVPVGEVEVPDSGCCGMAGAWGYERGHYEVSEACGERVLLPKVREEANDSLIVTAGFSCRSQIEQGTPRRAMHVAQAIQLARDHGAEG